MRILLCFLTLLPCLDAGCRAREDDTYVIPNLEGIEDLFVGQPTIQPNPIERVPLVAIVDFESPVPVVPTLEVTDGDRKWEQPYDVKPSHKHRLAVLGMRPDREHTIRVRVDVLGTDRSQLSEPLKFVTPPLPKSFPPLEVLVSKPEEMEPGITMFAANIWRDSTSILDYGYIIALDSAGEVVWFNAVQDRIADMKILSNGNILYQHGNYRYAYEVDILGRDVNRWVATNLTHLPKESIPIEIDTTHHDIIEMPSGNFLTIATELRYFEEFPTSEFDAEAPTAPAHVVCDELVEFDRKSGKIAQRFALKDVLDTERIGYISLGSFWKDKYNDLIQDMSRDWCHANALLYLPEDDSVIVSFRHLDCVMKIDWDTKKIRWILGNHEGWGPRWKPYLLKPIGNVEWAYHQHSPQITPNGTLILFDNGNYRARPFQKATLAPDNQSRVVEYKIDEEKMTVEQVYEFRGAPGDEFYSPFYCEADWLPQTDNILITDGGRIELDDGTPHDDVPGERQWARILEITREHQRTVFEVRLDSGLQSNFGWSIYRSMRLPNLWEPFNIDPLEEGEVHYPFTRARHIKRQNIDPVRR